MILMQAHICHICKCSCYCRQEMLRRYPNQEATMGEARLVGETGPDAAGNRLTPTTIKVSHAVLGLCFHFIQFISLTTIQFTLHMKGICHRTYVQPYELFF